MDYPLNFLILNIFKQEVIMNHEQVVYIYGIHLNFYILNVQTELREIKKELKSSENFEDFRSHANVYKAIHEFLEENPGISFKNTLSYFIKNNPYNFDYVVKNIDVYSLGMLMPVLFYNVGLLEKIKESEIIKRFFAFLD